MIINGKTINENVFNLINDGKTHKVEVIMGK